MRTGDYNERRTHSSIQMVTPNQSIIKPKVSRKYLRNANTASVFVINMKYCSATTKRAQRPIVTIQFSQRIS